MKKTIYLLSFVLSSIQLTYSQTTAVNFNCDDCHAVNHDLFSELNSGKVIVIAWVMPCAGCINGALAGYNAVESFATSNPNQVEFFLVDDYANTSCSTLSTWGNNNGMVNAIPFSNSLINMADYGTDGMPKVIVLGGWNHEVFYNQNNSSINQNDITVAINSALATSSINETVDLNKKLNIYPNPSNNLVKIDIESSSNKEQFVSSIIIKDMFGKEILKVFNAEYITGQNDFQFNVSNLSSGNYYIHIIDDNEEKIEKIVVIH